MPTSQTKIRDGFANNEDIIPNMCSFFRGTKVQHVIKHSPMAVIFGYSSTYTPVSKLCDHFFGDDTQIWLRNSILGTARARRPLCKSPQFYSPQPKLPFLSMDAHHRSRAIQPNIIQSASLRRS